MKKDDDRIDFILARMLLHKSNFPQNLQLQIHRTHDLWLMKIILLHPATVRRRISFRATP
jgi:hypothetical protein